MTNYVNVVLYYSSTMFINLLRAIYSKLVVVYEKTE